MLRSIPTRLVIEISKKIAKKKKKNSKTHYGCFSSQNILGKVEKERKLKLSFRSIPTQRLIENSKKIAKKIQKIKKHHLASFQAKKGRERLRKRESKNYRSNQCLPDS